MSQLKLTLPTITKREREGGGCPVSPERNAFLRLLISLLSFYWQPDIRLLMGKDTDTSVSIKGVVGEYRRPSGPTTAAGTRDKEFDSRLREAIHLKFEQLNRYRITILHPSFLCFRLLSRRTPTSSLIDGLGGWVVSKPPSDCYSGNPWEENTGVNAIWEVSIVGSLSGLIWLPSHHHRSLVAVS